LDRQLPKKRWKPRRDIPVAAAALLLIFLIIHIVASDHSARLNVQSERITISTVEKGPFQEFIPVTGTVIPIRTVYLDAMEGGRVAQRLLEAGAVVNQGDPILKLENVDLRLNSLNREADLAEQSNALRNTRLDMERTRLSLQSQLADINYEILKSKRIYERYEILMGKDLISQQEYDDARDSYQYLLKRRELTIESHHQDSIFRAVQIKNLEESLDRMQENLRLIRLNLENLTVKAPISGQLTSLVPEIGESIGKGERIGQIDVLDGFKVRVEVDEHYIARINPGQEGEFDFNGRSYRLVIRKIYPEVTEGRFEVDMLFTGEEPEGIRRGQTLHIRLELGGLSEAVMLARGGFYQKTGGQWVFVVNQDGSMAEKRDIRLGRQNTEKFEVLAGLKPGERVITSSYDTYGDVDKLVLKR